MFDDKYKLYARFKGSDAGKYYEHNKNYLIVVRIGRFNHRVQITNFHGYGDQEVPESKRRYESKAEFEQTWKVIKEVEPNK